MFFFTNYSLPAILAFLGSGILLLLVNEVTRRSKKASLIFFIAVPVLLTVFVWPKTAGSGTSGGYWFAWVKTYSALAGVIGFMAYRYIKKLQSNKIMMVFPGFILAFNILEAVIRDLECFGVEVIESNGLTIYGGPWNLINAIAGIISIITITGYFGVKVCQSKGKDMIWPDQLWFWIIAYDLWNISYTYNCIPDRSFYTGVLLIVTATIAEFFIKKGAWLQHRAQTLAMWGMLTLTMQYADSPLFSITTTHNPKAMLVLSISALCANMAVLVYQVYRIVKTKRNPYKNDLYTDLKAYKTVVAENKLELPDEEVVYESLSKPIMSN